MRFLFTQSLAFAMFKISLVIRMRLGNTSTCSGVSDLMIECRWLMIAQENGLQSFAVWSESKSARFAIHIARHDYESRCNVLAICNRVICFDDLGNIVGDM